MSDFRISDYDLRISDYDFFSGSEECVVFAVPYDLLYEAYEENRILKQNRQGRNNCSKQEYQKKKEQNACSSFTK